jgi:hypothetical protein
VEKDYLLAAGGWNTCVVIGAFVTLLGITVASIYRAVADVSEEAKFRTHTEDRLGNIETQLLELRASQSPKAVLKQINELDPKTFAKALPALRKVAEQPVSEVAPNEATLHQIATQLRNTSETTPDYWSTVLRFIQFATAGFSPNAPPPGPPQSVLSNVFANGPTALVLRTYSNEVVLLEGGELWNARFENCRIIFTQNPVRMHNFTFINCVFEMPITDTPSPYLKSASQLLLASNLRSVKIPSL